MHVLFVDDEPAIRQFVSRALSAAGIGVTLAEGAQAALELLRRETFDAVVLDVAMRGMSGVELLPKVLDAAPGQRVIMLSALTDARTRVKCLELGAVDYLGKPFAVAELVLRLRIHAGAVPGDAVEPERERRSGERRQGDRRAGDRRRSASPSADDEPEAAGERWVRAPGAVLDTVERRLVLGGRPVSLSERETLVLACLMRRCGNVCSRQELLDLVWGRTATGSGNVVDVYVGRLRSKLPVDTIRTVRNAGYVFGAA